MRFLLIILLLTPLFSQGQINITDTTFIVGITQDNNTNASTKIGTLGFKSGEEIDIPSKSGVLIIGAKRCDVGGKNFDYYEVIYKGNVYFLNREDILVTKISNSSELIFDDFLKLTSDQLSKFRSYSIKIAAAAESERKNKALKFFESCKKIGLILLKNSIYDESEYTSGTSFKYEIQNLSNKTIKYITFNLIGYNSVDDKITERGVSIKSVKGIGPIKPNNTASFEFKYVWFTDLVETFKITKIKIEYMDGGLKVIDNPRSIILSEEDYNVLMEKG